MLRDLVDILNRVGKPAELYKSPDGSTVLVLPYGGRILGLFAPRSEENFFWTHPALASVEPARAFYASGVWHNSGGDRTWLAPEADLFFPDFPDLKTYWQPRELDPGSYHVVRAGDRLALVNQLTVRLSRSKLKASLEISKSVGPALNPLRYEPLLQDIADVEYAGYTLHTSLTFMEGKDEDSTQVGLWDLLQMPHGGELLASTYSHTEPKVLMGAVGPEDLIVTDHLVRYRMRAWGEHKIGIRALATTGRVGYVYSMGDKSVLLVRNFSVNPSGEYIDVPWRDTTDFGYSTQACNVNSALGSFSELEYHVPAIGKGTGRSRADDVSQVWAFRGPRPRIQTIARGLLSPEA
jgi:hypothetical protein